MNKYSLEKITAENIDDFFKVLEGDMCENCQCTYFYKAGEDIDWPNIRLEKTRKWRIDITDNFSDGYILYSEAEPIGWCQCVAIEYMPYIQHLLNISPEKDHSIVSCLFLKKEYRGKGLATKLVEKVISKCLEEDVAVLYAIPAQDVFFEDCTTEYKEMNAHTGYKSLFEKFGFEMFGQSKRYYFMKKCLK